MAQDYIFSATIFIELSVVYILHWMQCFKTFCEWHILSKDNILFLNIVFYHYLACKIITYTIPIPIKHPFTYDPHIPFMLSLPCHTYFLANRYYLNCYLFPIYLRNKSAKKNQIKCVVILLYTLYIDAN